MFDKAASLLVGLIQGHFFDSGNRRTAYLAAKLFLKANGTELQIEYYAPVFTGIREGFYGRAEVINWLKGNGIREFNRP